MKLFDKISIPKINLHWSLLIILFISFMAGGFFESLFIVTVYACILLHELGHIFAAQYLGHECGKITLMIFGGLANIDIPLGKKDEFIIGIAGPIVSLFLALIFGTLSLIFDIEFIERITKANFLLSVINLLPIMPLDGSRCMRSILCTRFNFDILKATKLLSYFGCSIILIINIILIFNSVYIYLPVSSFVLFLSFLEYDYIKNNINKILFKQYKLLQKQRNDFEIL